MTDLGLNVYPCAVNDLGVSVGQGPTGGVRGAVVDKGGGFKNLTNLVPEGSRSTLNTAVGINDKGQIVANGSKATGQSHALLLLRI